jgi:hypothetical protein
LGAYHGQGQYAPLACRASDQVAVGINGRAGDFVHAIGLICAARPGLRIIDPNTPIDGQTRGPDSTQQPGDTLIQGQHKNPLPRGAAPKQ